MTNHFDVSLAGVGIVVAFARCAEVAAFDGDPDQILASGSTFVADAGDHDLELAHAQMPPVSGILGCEGELDAHGSDRVVRVFECVHEVTRRRATQDVEQDFLGGHTSHLSVRYRCAFGIEASFDWRTSRPPCIHKELILLYQFIVKKSIYVLIKNAGRVIKNIEVGSAGPETRSVHCGCFTKRYIKKSEDVSFSGEPCFYFLHFSIFRH